MHDNHTYTFAELVIGDYEQAALHETEKRIAGTGFLRAFAGQCRPRRLPVLGIRISQALQSAGVPIIPKLIAMGLFVVFGVEFAAQCKIAPGLYLPHPQGTILGAAVIGRNALIFQQVTLGAKQLDNRFDILLRPHLGDNITVGAGARILGGIKVGSGATIGANAVITKDVPDGATMVSAGSRMLEKT
jgi:serine O-acetyltransferase